MSEEKKGEKIRRREAVKVIAAGSATFLPLSQLASTPAQAQKIATAAEAASSAGPAAWKPRFFTDSQNELVTTIAELIIPETDTPGAREAKVNEHIDLVLSEELPDVQNTFLDGLTWIERRSQQLFGSAFLKLAEDEQVEILAGISDPEDPSSEDETGKKFFQDIRQRTVFAYYTSKMGIHQELEYKGKTPLPEWTGCTDPEHIDDEGERR